MAFDREVMVHRCRIDGLLIEHPWRIDVPLMVHRWRIEDPSMAVDESSIQVLNCFTY